MAHYDIKGKYKVTRTFKEGGLWVTRDILTTDNHREALWVGNKRDDYSVHNICGEKEFYKDDAGWHVKQ